MANAQNKISARKAAMAAASGVRIFNLNAASVKEDLRALGYSKVSVSTGKRLYNLGALQIHLRSDDHAAALEYFARKNIVECLLKVAPPQKTQGSTYAYLYGAEA